MFHKPENRYICCKKELTFANLRDQTGTILHYMWGHILGRD
ncbi:MAG: hypothetical protein ACO3NK_10770 [Prochlorotrichaceae cyanobacterium]